MKRVAFITGASSGFGAGFARRLVADGYDVGLAARRVDRLDELAAELRAEGAAAVVCACDVTRRAQVEAAVRETEAELGPVDLLIANAGLSLSIHPLDFSVGDVEYVMRVNFFGAVYAIGCVLPGMLERDRGHLVAIGSLAGYGGLPNTSAYAASKGALHNFMESLRVDLRNTGVDVTMITPGYVKTELTELSDHPQPFQLELDGALDRMMKAIRARRRLYSFPRPMSTVTWLAQILPPAVYDRLAAKVRREKRRPPSLPKDIGDTYE